MAETRQLDQTHLFVKIFQSLFYKKYWYFLVMAQNDIAKFLFKNFLLKISYKILNPSLKKIFLVPKIISHYRSLIRFLNISQPSEKLQSLTFSRRVKTLIG